MKLTVAKVIEIATARLEGAKALPTAKEAVVAGTEELVGKLVAAVRKGSGSSAEITVQVRNPDVVTKLDNAISLLGVASDAAVEGNEIPAICLTGDLGTSRTVSISAG